MKKFYKLLFILIIVLVLELIIIFIEYKNTQNTINNTGSKDNIVIIVGLKSC